MALARKNWPKPSLVNATCSGSCRLFFYREIGNGATTLFWKDKWLQGENIGQLAPRLLATVPRRIINHITIQEAIIKGSWICDIKGALSVGAIVDFLSLWDLLQDVEL
jgi:hypothetical protein